LSRLTFLATILTDHRLGLGALLAHVSLFATNIAVSRELAGVRALGLVVATEKLEICDMVSSFE
jgi:cobalamin synthase